MSHSSLSSQWNVFAGGGGEEMDRNSNGDSTCKKRMNSLFISPSAPSPAVCPILCLSVHNVDRFFSLCPVVVVVVCFPVKICLKKASSNKKIVMLKRKKFSADQFKMAKVQCFLSVPASPRGQCYKTFCVDMEYFNKVAKCWSAS